MRRRGAAATADRAAPLPAAGEGVDVMAAAGSGSTAPPPDASGSDPPPVPPQKPLPFDCCESGCDRCVYDIYADELEHYQSVLAAWHARNGGRDPHVG